MTKALALLILAAILIGITVLVCVEHRPNGYAMPMLFSSAAQSDTARANMLLSPCPLTPQNLRRIPREEQA